METEVKVYSSTGARLRNRPVENVQRLAALNMLVIRRNRRGHILCAQFREMDGANPLRSTAHMGTKYSFQESLPGGGHCWRHRKLMREDLVSVFRAVPLSCMK